MIRSLLKSSSGARAIALAVLWLGTISVLHARYNGEKPVAQKVSMGYMPVIANLAAPLVDLVTRERETRFEAIKFGSFAEMAEAFKAGHIQVAFIIAPLAIVLFQQGVPLKVVYIGNRHESTLVVGKDLDCETLSSMAGKRIAVPIRYSGHLLALHRGLRSQGMDPRSVEILEIPPPDMPSALATGAIDGYFVGEPFASKSLQNGTGKRLLDVEAIWPKFICNLMIVREDLIRNHSDQVRTLVSAAVRSGLWARSHTEEAVSLVSQYWGQDPRVIRYAFEHPPGRVRFDLFAPVVEEMEEVALEMRKAGLLEGDLDLRSMVDDRYAKAVKIEPVDSLDDVLSQ
jgi:NitT/TauT family transport system substrate-binding protein